MTCAASAQTVQKKASAGAAKGEAYVEKSLASQGLDGQVYGELGLSFLHYKIARAGISAKPIMLRGIVGYDYHPNLAAEAMLEGRPGGHRRSCCASRGAHRAGRS